MTATVNDPKTAPVLAAALPTTGATKVVLPLRNIAQPNTAARSNIKQQHERLFQPLQEFVDESNVAEKEALPPTIVEQLCAVIEEQDAKQAE